MAERVVFRGRLTCSCNVKWLPLLERVLLARGLLQNSLDIYQLSYSGGVGASAGTHDRGGCSDLGQDSPEQIAVIRWAGGTHQARYRWQGFDPHAHGYPFGCPHLSPAARAQNIQWLNRQNGLISHGRVEGPWPVVDWRTGVKRMEKELTAFADEIVAETTKKVLGKVGEEVLTRDNVIANTFTDDPDNRFVTLRGALELAGTKLNGLARDNDSTDGKIAELVKSQKAADAANAAQIAALTKSVSDLAAVVATMTVGGSDGPIPAGG